MCPYVLIKTCCRMMRTHLLLSRRNKASELCKHRFLYMRLGMEEQREITNSSIIFSFVSSENGYKTPTQALGLLHPSRSIYLVVLSLKMLPDQFSCTETNAFVELITHLKIVVRQTMENYYFKKQQLCNSCDCMRHGATSPFQ